jgi:fibronectin-binding autotransporter adhesin
VFAHRPTSMRNTPSSLVRVSFLLSAAALSLIQAEAADITVNSGTTSIGTGAGASLTSAQDIMTVNGGMLEVTSNSTIGGLTGAGGQISAGFQNAAYSGATLTINVAEGSNYLYNGTIRPNNNDGNSVNPLLIVKTGAGTQELAGVLIRYDTSIGTTDDVNRPKIIVNQGTLKMSGAWGFDIFHGYGGNAITVNSGGTVDFMRSVSYGSGNALNQLSNNANNILVNGGTLRFSAVNQAFGRSFTVGSGGAVFSVAAGITFRSTGSITGSTGGNLTLDGESTDSTFTMAVGGTGTWASGSKLIKSGTGTWTVGGVGSALSGGIQVGQGTLILTANSASIGATVISAGGTLEVRSTLVGGAYAGAITNSGALVFDSTSAQAINGVISGTGRLETKNAGALTLGAANSFSGEAVVTAGSLRLNHVDALKFSKLVTNSAAGSVVFGVAAGTYNVGALSGNGTFALSDTAATPGAITLVTGNANVAESFSGVLSGLGNLRKAGTNTLTLTGANTYAGQTIVSSGTLALSGAGTLGSGGVQLNGGTLDLSASTVAFTQSVNFNGGVLTGGSLDVAQVASAQSGTVSTALTGTGGLTKTGAGLLVLGAGVTHAYSGPTLVNEGKLKVDGIIASSITVANGAALGGHGVINGNVLMSAGSTIAAGGSVGNLTVASLTITAGTQVAWEVYDAEGVAGVGYDKITVNGALDLSGLSGANRATLVLSSLSNPLNNLSGNAGFFDASLDHTFTLFTYGSLDLGSNTDIASIFTVDKSLVSDPAGVPVAGVFFVFNNVASNSLELRYVSAIPEPSTYGLSLGCLGLAVAAVRRRRRLASA